MQWCESEPVVDCVTMSVIPVTTCTAYSGFNTESLDMLESLVAQKANTWSDHTGIAPGAEWSFINLLFPNQIYSKFNLTRK